MRKIDEVGNQYGYWLVIADAPTRSGVRFVLARCACGTEKAVQIDALRNRGGSCGCWRATRMTARNRTHGMKHLPEYQVWNSMRQRCEVSTNCNYAKYGARGITVCERWTNFEAFYADMGPRPSASHSIERIDNDGHYTPENCRWATRVEQQNNKRTNLVITYDGKTQTIAQWAREMGVPDRRLRVRYHLGWSPADILELPPKR